MCNFNQNCNQKQYLVILMSHPKWCVMSLLFESICACSTQQWAGFNNNPELSNNFNKPTILQTVKLLNFKNKSICMWTMSHRRASTRQKGNTAEYQRKHHVNITVDSIRFLCKEKFYNSYFATLVSRSPQLPAHTIQMALSSCGYLPIFVRHDFWSVSLKLIETGLCHL